MGLITELLALPLAPVRGALWVMDQLVLTAEQQYYDPEPVVRQLAELEQELLDGRITEEEFDRVEDQLLDELEWRQAWQRQQQERS
ncbi:gas vesicle protein GvpG [Streptomyces sp. WMMB 322]|uniref:gas vesicle protein GvpG n=1 Tax=Streptomyces sp. WMMB 322 TaxID=1286821 RepID=UPI0006E19865|nr:gas vesicle protein GvpG [Streptomyces sp. WMMB 322]SCK52238.1 Gas vesicle protein G [Streptomyces sp. WMMB 322]